MSARCWLEGNTHRIDAVAIAGWCLRGIVENVTQVTTAICTPHLGANHPVTAILDVLNRLVVLGLEKTRPAAVRIKLGIALKEKSVATAAVKTA